MVTAAALLPRLNTGELPWFPWGPLRTDGRGPPYKRREVSGRIVVSLTRVAPRALDSDNLVASLKATRAGVADALHLDDRDSRVEWRYAQRKGRPREYGVSIAIGPCDAGEHGAEAAKTA
jgi:hypothetical protein